MTFTIVHKKAYTALHTIKEGCWVLYRQVKDTGHLSEYTVAEIKSLIQYLQDILQLQKENENEND